MFTGIVQHKARVRSFDRNDFGARLVVDHSAWRPACAIEPGHSICVSGVCLTVVATDESTMAFDVIAETLAKTSLGDVSSGDAVNLEHALLPTTPMGGHFLQGHVDAVGRVTRVVSTAEECRITVTPPVELMDYIVPKGSVGIDGVSLTVASVTRDDFDVALIPTTLAITTLGTLRDGDRVNLETDIISKTIVHWLQRRQT